MPLRSEFSLSNQELCLPPSLSLSLALNVPLSVSLLSCLSFSSKDPIVLSVEFIERTGNVSRIKMATEQRRSGR